MQASFAVTLFPSLFIHKCRISTQSYVFLQILINDLSIVTTPFPSPITLSEALFPTRLLLTMILNEILQVGGKGPEESGSVVGDGIGT